MGADDTAISQIRWDGIQLRFFDSNNPEALNVGAYFATGGPGNAQTLYLTAKNGAVVTTESFAAATYLASSNTAARVDFVNLPPTVEALLDGLSVGDRLIVSGGRVAVDHAVDADPVAVAYAVPPATVTHTLPDTHGVDADPVAVAYAIPQPTVTHTAHVPDSHTVDADPVTVTYDVPHPSVTHTPLIGTDYTVDADPVAVAYAVPQPAVSHTRSDALLFSEDGAVGTVDDMAPAGMFTDSGVFWVGEVLIEDTANGTLLTIQRGGSAVNARTFADTWTADWGLYVLQESSREHVVLRAHTTHRERAAEVNWRSDGWDEIDSNVADPAAWLLGLTGTLIVALAPFNDFVPY